jgi:hypothetical protein
MQHVWFSSPSCLSRGLPVFPLRLAYPLLSVQRYRASWRDRASASRPQRQRAQSRSPLAPKSSFQLEDEGGEPPDYWVNTS